GEIVDEPLPNPQKVSLDMRLYVGPLVGSGGLWICSPGKSATDARRGPLRVASGCGALLRQDLSAWTTPNPGIGISRHCPCSPEHRGRSAHRLDGPLAGAARAGRGCLDRTIPPAAVLAQEPDVGL